MPGVLRQLKVSTLHGSLLGFGEEALTRVPPKDDVAKHVAFNPESHGL